jgi:hypothetical protein
VKAYTLKETARLLTQRLRQQGIDRIVEEQTLRVALREGTLPVHRAGPLGTYVVTEDDLGQLRVKVVGSRIRAPVLYKVPEGYDECLTVDEVGARMPEVARNTVRYHLREKGDHPERGANGGVGGFVDSFKIRRNWLLPVWLAKDEQGNLVGYEARWKDGTRRRLPVDPVRLSEGEVRRLSQRRRAEGESHAQYIARRRREREARDAAVVEDGLT